MEEAQLREDLKAVEAALKKTKKVMCSAAVIFFDRC